MLGVNIKWISNLSTRKKLDIVLKHLNHDKTEPDSFIEITDALKDDVSLPDVHRCIDQLIKDEFVGEIKSNKIFIADLNVKFGTQLGKIEGANHSISTYYITIEGKNFIKSGGYKRMLWQIWRWKRFWTEIFFPALTVILTILNLFITKNNSKLEKEKEQTNKRLTELEKQVYDFSKNKPLIQNFYVLPDSIKQDSNHLHKR